MLNRILEVLHDYALAYNEAEGKYSFISANIHDLTEYNACDFENDLSLLDKLVDPKDIAKVKALHDKPITDTSTDITYRIKTAHGTVKWVNEKRSLFIDGITGSNTLLTIIKDVQRDDNAKYNREESMEEYSILFDSNPNPMWIYEATTLRVLKMNRAAIEVYGYSKDEFLAMTILDFHLESERENLMNFLMEKGIYDSTFQDHSKSGIWKHINKRGEVVYAEVSGDSIRYKNHDCRIVVANNVTQTIHYHDQVKIREQFLNSLIDSQTSFLIRIDVNGNFTFVNKQFLKTFGFSRAELLGHHFSRTIIPEEAYLCEEAFYNCLNNVGKVIKLAHKKPDKLGKLHDTEWEFIAITDDNGKVTEVQGVGQDVTDRNNFQKEIIRAKNSLEALINNTDDLIWSIDRNLKYMYMNQAFKNSIASQTGMKPQAGDDSLHPVFDEDTMEHWRKCYTRALMGESYIVANETIDPSNNEISCFEVSFNPIFNVDSEIIGIGCFARDITERIKANKAIIDQNERLQNIASISSHELRRPVATMLGLIHVFDRQNFYNPDNKEIIEHLLTVGNEIDEVIRVIVDNTFSHKALIK